MWATAISRRPSDAPRSCLAWQRGQDRGYTLQVKHTTEYIVRVISSIIKHINDHVYHVSILSICISRDLPPKVILVLSEKLCGGARS